MRERYIPVLGVAKAETAKAFLLEPCIFDIDGAEHRHMELWIPKSQIHDDDHDEIENSVKGDDIEINVSDYWLRQNT